MTNPTEDKMKSNDNKILFKDPAVNGEITHSKENNTRRNKQRKGVSIKENNVAKMRDWKLVPPDGGWGWLVLFGATLVNMLIPGTIKSFGVLFVEFIEVFEASAATAAWIPALCYFLYSSLGPISSILSLRYSYRTVSLLGGTSAALGMIMSFYANSVTYLYISYGILVGTGAGLSFPPTVYIVTGYFERLRGLANGICISGSAIGSIILPPFLRFLLQTYGYRGAVLLMGGVTLNVWVASLFYDPVEHHMKKVPIEDDAIEETTEPEEEPLNVKATFSFSADDNNSTNQLNHNDSFTEMTSRDTVTRSASSAAMQNYRSPSGRERKISAPGGKGGLRSNKNSSTGLNHNNSSTGLNYLNSNSGLNVVQESDVHNKLIAKRTRTPRRSPSTSSFQYVSTPYHGSTLTLQPETFASTFSLKSPTRAPEESNQKKFFDVSLLRDPVYLIILVSNCTNAISYTNFVILLPSYALALGFDKDSGALLLSIVSALDLVGRIGGSALSDLPIMPKEWYFIGGLLISGISLTIMPFFASYGVISAYCALFGLASGVYVGVTAVIMADLLGTERIQSSYGISLFVNGIAQLIGPPICGVWYENTKSFTSLFCTLGIVLISGASIWGFLPFVRKKEEATSNELSEC